MNLWESQVKLFGSQGAMNAKQLEDVLSGINNNAQGTQSQNSGRWYIPPEVPPPVLPYTPMRLTEAILLHIAPNKVRKEIAHKNEEKDIQKRKEHNIKAIMQMLKTGSYTAPNPMIAIAETRGERIKWEANALSRKHSNMK